MNNPVSKYNKLEIKKILFTENDFLRTVPLIILIFIGYGKVPNHYLMLLLVVIIVFLIISLRRIIDRNTQFIFDRTGIYDNKNQVHYSWNFINEIEFYVGQSDSLKLVFKYKFSTVVLNFDNLSTSPKEIAEFIKTIDSNKLRDKEKELKQEVTNILRRNENSEFITKVFKQYKLRTGWLMGISFFGILALAIFLQIKFTFPYSFAIGWLLVLTTLTSINVVSEKGLRESELIIKLSENQFNELMIQFALRSKDDKRKKRIGYIAMSIITIGIFVVSYFLSDLK
jgi:hypothetical protein